MANVARLATDEAASASSSGAACGYSAYPTGWPSRLRSSWLTTCHTRPTVASAVRWACDSDVRGVIERVKAFP